MQVPIQGEIVQVNEIDFWEERTGKMFPCLVNTMSNGVEIMRARGRQKNFMFSVTTKGGLHRAHLSGIDGWTTVYAPNKNLLLSRVFRILKNL